MKMIQFFGRYASNMPLHKKLGYNLKKNYFDKCIPPPNLNLIKSHKCQESLVWTQFLKTTTFWSCQSELECHFKDDKIAFPIMSVLG